MSIFAMHRHILDAHCQYVQSFLSIANERIRKFVERELLHQGKLWPEALLQLNPSYEMAATVEELVGEGKLHSSCKNIFLDKNGQSIRGSIATSKQL